MASTTILLTFGLYLRFVQGGFQDVPIGHMQPLGGHASPSAVEERYDIPSAEEFWGKYVKPMKPVIFRGLNKVSPVFTKWTDEYLKENFGDMEMRVEAKREFTDETPTGDMGLGRDTLRNFINTYHGKTKKYVISDMPKPMYKDFLVPPFVGCGTFADRLVEVDVWIGGGGSSSLIHKDAFNIINCLFNGTKEWKMIELKHEENIYKVQEEEGRLSGKSAVDPMKVDLKKFPNIQKVPWSFVNVTPGDCLFIPRQMYHQVRSFGTHNLAISLLFSRFVKDKALNFSNCPASGFKPLTDFDPDWQYEGSGAFPMGRADLEYGTKDELYTMLNKKGRLILGELRDNLKTVYTYSRYGRTDKDVDQLVEQFYALFDKKVGDMITRNEIKALKKKELREIAFMFALSDPYSSKNYEYHSIDALALIRVLDKELRSQGVLEKKRFIRIYLSKFEGTREAAEIFFNKLGGELKDSITKETVLENINKAIEKYDVLDLQYHKYSPYGKKDMPIVKIDYRSLIGNPDKIDDAEREERSRELDSNGNLMNSGEEGNDDDDEGRDGNDEDEEDDDEGRGDSNENEDDDDDNREGEGNEDGEEENLKTAPDGTEDSSGEDSKRGKDEL